MFFFYFDDDKKFYLYDGFFMPNGNFAAEHVEIIKTSRPSGYKQQLTLCWPVRPAARPCGGRGRGGRSSSGTSPPPRCPRSPAKKGPPNCTAPTCGRCPVNEFNRLYRVAN